MSMPCPLKKRPTGAAVVDSKLGLDLRESEKSNLREMLGKVPGCWRYAGGKRLRWVRNETNGDVLFPRRRFHLNL